MAKRRRPRTALVMGDAVCDHNYYRGNRQTADSTEPLGVRVALSGGGALLLKDIIAATLEKVFDWTTALGVSPDYQRLPPALHSHCVFESQIANPEEEDRKKQYAVWRAVEPPLGYGQPPAPVKSATTARSKRAKTGGPLAPRGIVVVDDAGLGFRTGPYQQCWPFAGDVRTAEKPEWIVLKMSGSSFGGALWNTLVSRFSDRLIVIVSADDLRRAPIRIGRGVSWEATAEDVSAELRGNPLLKPLGSARHIIVTFGSDGAFWLDKERARAKLVFDAAGAEGEWSPGPGGAFGFLSCFTAAVVRELARTEDEKKKGSNWPDFEGALSAGLSASRECRRLGHGKVYSDQEQGIINASPGFPFDAVAERIHDAASAFVSAEISFDDSSRGDWMMLDEWHGHARRGAGPQPHFQAALAVAIGGPSTLGQFPVARFGDLRTVDRKEIESLRTIRQLIRSYKDGGPQKKPLSLAVFGPPGAGKSFGVIQIAKSVLGSKDEDILTFNLSQYSAPSDLNGALHRVRDRALSGITPLVFWDEFDSEGYKWLQYLLAPMQDGEFQEGQISHPIGKCVFVFAGATSPTFEAFGPRNPHDRKERLDFVLKKGPDFKSRIAAYLNVLGPNQRQVRSTNGVDQWQDDPTDVCYPIRRALFIRSQFKLKDHQRLQLDMGVIRALLEVPSYRSGARSLEFLCRQLRDQANSTPTRSSLPGPTLLDLHVDAKAFWNICERDAEFVAVAHELAPVLHENWRKHLKKDERSNEYNVPWESLASDGKEANVAQATRIPRILAAAGLRVVRGRPLPRAAEDQMRRRVRAHADLLAEVEHNFWMVERMLGGWRFGRKRDKSKKLHPLLIPYSQLPDVQQEKDRRVVRGQRAATAAAEVSDYINLVKYVGFRVEPNEDPKNTRKRGLRGTRPR